MIANVDLGGDSQARGRISGELAHGTPECEKLRRCDEVLLAVVNRQWQASLAQHRCWRKSDLSEPYPKGVRGFETVWHVDGHFCLAGISSGSHRAVRAFLWLANDRFGFQVLLQPEDPAFPTDPGLFEPTEGSKRIVT